MRGRLVDQWFEVTLPLPAARFAVSDAWSALRSNARFRGAVRVALAIGADEPHLRGEIMVDGDDPLETRVAALRSDAQAALHALHDRIDADSSPSDPAGVADSTGGERRLVQLCVEAGWPFTERADGSVEVPIECGPSLYHARLRLQDDGALCAVTDLVEASTLTSTGRAAAALLLLNASALVRSVKGVLVRHDGVEHAGLAAACERPRSGADVDRALAAITVACGLAGREAQALRHDALAREYLAWRAPAFYDESRDASRSFLDDDGQSHINTYAMEESPCLQQL